MKRQRWQCSNPKCRYGMWLHVTPSDAPSHKCDEKHTTPRKRSWPMEKILEAVPTS
jgi:hypothetical protein